MINLVIAAWGGPRRAFDALYEADRAYYLKQQVKKLSSLTHNLDQITIMNSGGDSDAYNEYLKVLPTLMDNTYVIGRLNAGLSYGALSDAYRTYRLDFDYYIFLEDDYLFIEDNFDKTLVRMHNSYDNCGYLCSLRFENPIHASICNGIFDSKTLEAVWTKYGCLPHASTADYGLAEGQGQIGMSQAVLAIGREIYDIGREYRVPYFGGSNQDRQICWYHVESEKTLIAPTQWQSKP